ncbi:hypothetical protein [Streptomyces albidocamelliae]|uniref:Uncharacterized protein n=1 Tax=Streptomyces albidocamelliae TaxID=2981135 RepID=A0ABY6EFV8_9ACTN|nr:hypothetical protein [Streptomyces sp. HUAS 14-6]UXY33751.1 hypothetical protein N8I86_02770 [Streptomyces sp. HUAS 14-6]
MDTGIDADGDGVDAVPLAERVGEWSVVRGDLDDDPVRLGVDLCTGRRGGTGQVVLVEQQYFVGVLVREPDASGARLAGMAVMRRARRVPAPSRPVAVGPRERRSKKPGAFPRGPFLARECPVLRCCRPTAAGARKDPAPGRITDAASAFGRMGT